jgi:tetratricopeptide (TPR) repeat protein
MMRGRARGDAADVARALRGLAAMLLLILPLACARTRPPAGSSSAGAGSTAVAGGPASASPDAPGSPAEDSAAAAGSPLALANLAASLAASGNLAGAEAALRRALEMSPDSPPLLAELARVRLEGGREAEAIEPAVRAADLGGGADGRMYLLATSVRLRAGQASQAEADLSRWERASGASALLRVSRGLVREQEGRGAEAEREYRAGLRLDPGCEDALSGLVKLRFENGDAAGALAVVRGSRAGGVAPRLWEAQALRRLNRIVEAEGALRDALAAEPDHAAALAELGAVRAARGDYGEARALLARALEIDPGLEAARANLAEVDRRLAAAGAPTAAHP